jgi:ABC-type multidrug transport system permease subunit
MRGSCLAKQNKVSPSDKEALLLLLIQAAPFLGLGLLATILGYQLVNTIPVAARTYIQVAFLAFLFAMVILDKEPGWNMALFLAFGMAAGMMLHWSSADLSQLKTWILFSTLLLFSITGGLFLKRETERAAGILFINTFLYMVGWFLFIVTSLPDIVRTIWIVLGLLLFILVTMVVINRGKTQISGDSVISYSIQLFVILFNLFWLSSLL